MNWLAQRCLLLSVMTAAGLAVAPAGAWAFGQSLDALYRDNVRADNNGVLPPYFFATIPPPYPEPKPDIPDPSAAKLPADAGQTPPPSAAPEMPWLEVVKQVAGGAPGPFAVDAVRRKAEAADPQAVELYAWMNATGTGVKRDLAQAFTLYLQADGLNVPGAKDNAKAIYNALDPAGQKALFNPYQ